MESAKITSAIKEMAKALGPGLITGASDDDPSGIATYSQAGAQTGLATLWTALLTFPLMAAIQGMCARIGLVTGRGLTLTIREHYPKGLLYGVLLMSFPAITLNIGANIEGMAAVANMIFPAVPVPAFCLCITAVLIAAIIAFPYRKIANILKWLCLSLLLYMAVPFMMDQDWVAVARNAFIPTIALNKDFILILVAIFGTTISPYLFFWQATMEAEDAAHGRQDPALGRRSLADMRKDVNAGMLLSNLVMFFIILTAGSVLYPAGIRRIDTVAQAAAALEPLTGRLTYLIFAAGVLGTGFLSIPVLAGSQSYMLAETFGWKTGLDKKFHKARLFYISIIFSLAVSVGLDFFGISAIQALLYTAVCYGLTAPVMVAVVLHIGSNRKIMGENTNSMLSNALGAIALIIMSAAAFALLYFLFF